MIRMISYLPLQRHSCTNFKVFLNMDTSSSRRSSSAFGSPFAAASFRTMSGHKQSPGSSSDTARAFPKPILSGAKAFPYTAHVRT